MQQFGLATVLKFANYVLLVISPLVLLILLRFVIILLQLNRERVLVKLPFLKTTLFSRCDCKTQPASALNSNAENLEQDFWRAKDIRIRLKELIFLYLGVIQLVFLYFAIFIPVDIDWFVVKNMD